MTCFLSNIFKKWNTNKTVKSQEHYVFCEHPYAEIEFIPAELIVGVRDKDNPHFWNHHGNTKEFYIDLAEQSEALHEKRCAGASVEEIRSCEDLKKLSDIYLSDQFCIKLYKHPDGRYLLVDDGRHRVAAAQILGITIPAKVMGEYKLIEKKGD